LYPPESENGNSFVSFCPTEPISPLPYYIASLVVVVILVIEIVTQVQIHLEVLIMWSLLTISLSIWFVNAQVPPTCQIRVFADKLAVSIQACSYFELFLCFGLVVVAVSIGARNRRKSMEESKTKLEQVYEMKERDTGIDID